MKGNKRCEHYQVCPIYRELDKTMNFTNYKYKDLYCDAGFEGWKKCRRYQLAKELGNCPIDVTPNDPRTIEKLKKEYNL